VKSQLQAQKSSRTNSTGLAHHEESLPNASAMLSFSALAEVDDVLAAVRIGVLLARSCGSSLDVTILGEPLLSVEPDTLELKSLDKSLSAIRVKLLASQSMSHFHRFALVANISAATFLTAGTIALQINSADSISLNTVPR
jgi:hypothetical protein